MKKFLLVLVLVIVGGVVWWMNRPQPDASLPNALVTDVSDKNTDNMNSVTTIDNANVKIGFKGFGPGKVHEGSFSSVTSNLTLIDNKVAGKVEVDMNTLNSPDGEKLVTHLKSADFFDVAKYPKAVFEVGSSDGENLVGTLTMHGITKNVSLPMKKDGMQYVSQFNIGMKDFGINQKFAENVIEITVTVPLK